MTEEERIKRYKELSEKGSEKAPEGLWDAIDRKLDSELIANYTQQLHGQNAQAPEDLWDSIERKLDAPFIAVYQDQLSAQSQPAPDELWESIESGLDSKWIELYRQQLAQKQEKSPEGGWEAVQQSLDVDEVWKRVEANLSGSENTIILWPFVLRAVAVIAIIATIGMGTWMFTQRLSQKQIADANEPVVTEALEPSIAEILPPNFGEEALPINRVQLAVIDDVSMISDEELASEFVVNYLYTSGQKPVQLNLQNRQLALVEQPNLSAKDRHFSLPEQIANRLNIPVPTNLTHSIIADDTFLGNNLSLGLSLGVKNTWLFSNQTFLAITGYNGHRAKVSLIPDMAFNIRYQAAPRIELEAGLSFSSNIGQSYMQYIYGRFSRKDINLNYIHGEVLGNYLGRRWAIGQNTVRLNTTFGFYFAGLNNAYEAIDGEIFDQVSYYQNIDYGLILGQGIDIEMTGNFTFSPGLRLTWGLHNIHKRVPDSPEFMWRTHNRSIELRFAVFYNLPSRRQ